MLSRSPRMEAKRLMAVSLQEIPLRKRLAAYDALLAVVDDLGLKVELGQAAYHPSAQRYVISKDAYERVMGHEATE